MLTFKNTKYYIVRRIPHFTDKGSDCTLDCLIFQRWTASVNWTNHTRPKSSLPTIPLLKCVRMSDFEELSAFKAYHMSSSHLTHNSP